MVSKSMLNSLLQKQMTYQPVLQPYFTFRDGAWTAASSELSPSPSPLRKSNVKTIDTLRVITWNIDFMASQPRARMASALSYLEKLVSEIPASNAIVVQLQEMMESERLDERSPTDLTQLRDAPWIQRGFHLTDIDKSSHTAAYGQVTLIDRRLAVTSVSRMHFVSEYQRDALFVDVCLDTDEPSYLRLCNVHLDSSYGSLRPIQWEALQHHLQDSEKKIAASILAGDCNANQPRDMTAPQDGGFKDAFCELGGVEGDEGGATWGFQSLEGKQWGVQRLDKEVYWGAVDVDMLERIGVGVQVEDEKARKELENDEELTFATDHYGLMGSFTVKHELRTAVEELQN